MTALPPPAERYLRDLATALDGLPDASREAIVDDIRAHLADAAAEGRDMDATIAGLGSPASVARDAREQLGLPAASDPADRIRRFLHWTAAALALVTAAIVSFVMPSYAIEQEGVGMIGGTGDPLQTASTLFEDYGLGVALLPLIPVAVVLVQLKLSRGPRRIAGWVIAAAISVFAIIGGASVGGFYVPLALMLWAAVLVPWWVASGRSPVLGRIARLLSAAVLAAPVFFTFGGLITGTLQDADHVFWLVAAVLLALAVLFALRVPHVDGIVGAVGAGVMLLGAVDAGLLMIAFWWAGGLWLAIGASGAAARHGMRLAPRTHPLGPR